MSDLCSMIDDTTERLSNIYGGFKENKPRVKVDKSFCLRTSRGGEILA